MVGAEYLDKGNNGTESRTPSSWRKWQKRQAGSDKCGNVYPTWDPTDPNKLSRKNSFGTPYFPLMKLRPKFYSAYV